ncbi:MAG: metallophosphoesterase family protein [Candidatus Riflebacteria bacterium]|nr:metallophosphoesterase family protein [Candidatus Riflebacteria bacterium]
MKLGILSDTHLANYGNSGSGLPTWISKVFAGVDMILHAGDICDHDILSELAAIAPVYAVRGNMDTRMSDLPWTREIRLGRGNGTAVISHRPETAWGKAKSSPDAVIVIHGHTHLAECKQVDGVWLLNPGSPTRPRGGQAPSVAVVVIENGLVEAKLTYRPESADDIDDELHE